MTASRADEDFELELRNLSGVVDVGLTRQGDGSVTEVALLVVDGDRDEIHRAATQIASLNYPEALVSVERMVEGSSPAYRDNNRVVLVSADYDTVDGACEVKLAYNGRLGVGRSVSGPMIGGAEATIAALRDMGYHIPFTLLTVNSVSNGKESPVLVTLRSLSNDADRFGVARSEDDLMSAVKATLDSLNRFLTTLDGQR
jgi:hypothetical protein